MTYAAITGWGERSAAARCPKARAAMLLSPRAQALALGLALLLAAACERTPLPPRVPAKASAPDSNFRRQASPIRSRRHRAPAPAAGRRDDRRRARGDRGRHDAVAPRPPPEDVDALARRIGHPLPPSYRAYLETSNGMLFEGALNRVTMLPAAEVVPLSKQHDIRARCPGSRGPATSRCR